MIRGSSGNSHISFQQHLRPITTTLQASLQGNMASPCIQSTGRVIHPRMASFSDRGPTHVLTDLQLYRSFTSPTCWLGPLMDNDLPNNRLTGVVEPRITTAETSLSSLSQSRFKRFNIGHEFTSHLRLFMF